LGERFLFARLKCLDVDLHGYPSPVR